MLCMDKMVKVNKIVNINTPNFKFDLKYCKKLYLISLIYCEIKRKKNNSIKFISIFSASFLRRLLIMEDKFMLYFVCIFNFKLIKFS